MQEGESFPPGTVMRAIGYGRPARDVTESYLVHGRPCENVVAVDQQGTAHQLEVVGRLNNWDSFDWRFHRLVVAE